MAGLTATFRGRTARSLTFRRSFGTLSLWRGTQTPLPLRAGCVGIFFGTFSSDTLLGAWVWRASVWLPWRGYAEWLRRGTLCQTFLLVENFRRHGESAGPCVEERWWPIIFGFASSWKTMPCCKDVLPSIRQSTWSAVGKNIISFRCSSGKRTCSASIVDTRTQAHLSLTQHLHVHRPAVARRQRQEQWRKNFFSVYMLLSPFFFFIRLRVAEKHRLQVLVAQFCLSISCTDALAIFLTTAIWCDFKGGVSVQFDRSPYF